MAGRDRKRRVQRERYERKRAEFLARRKRNRFLKAGGSAVAVAAAIAGLVAWIVIGTGGGSADKVAASDTTSASPSPSPSPAPTYAAGCNSPPLSIATPDPNFPILPAGVSDVLKTPPTITVPAGPVPTKLKTKDIVVGKGATVGATDTVTVNYAGYDYVNCLPFDSSWNRQATTHFNLAGGTIPGFAQGITGMKIGGRREIIIPPALGYGAAGSGSIKPNEELVFVVDVLAASHASPSASPAATGAPPASTPPAAAPTPPATPADQPTGATPAAPPSP